MVSTAILTGALVVGDSVRYSLKQLALTRLGRTEFVLVAEDRFFRAELAEDIAKSVFKQTAVHPETAPVIQLRGIAVAEGGLYRANSIQVLGVDNRFWAIGWKTDRSGRTDIDTDHHAGNPEEVKSSTSADGSRSVDDFFTPDNSLNPDEAIINRHLAAKLGLERGDTFLLRVENPGRIPGDTPISSDSGSDVALRLTVKAIAEDSQFGRFSLRANQAAPHNVYLSLSGLGKKIDFEDGANLILVAGVTSAADRKEPDKLSIESLNKALKESWTLSDAGLELRALLGVQKVELTSTRVFLDPPAAEAALQTGANPEGILTYFVNSIHTGENSTPYSFVSAPGEPLVPENMSDDEIIINEWLSDDLGTGEGGTVSLTYYIPGSRSALEEETSTFTVRSVVSIGGPAADRNLMPEFHGLSDAASCRDWDPGIPINLDNIRKKDELYWDMYKGTPKAFVTLNSARKMWQNRFGSLTAVRYQGSGEQISDLSSGLLKKLDPASLGFQFLPIREHGVNAGMGAVDFGQLFMGLSIFIIISALLLTGLLFIFGIEHRSDETRLLFALGVPVSRVRNIFIIEGAVIAFFGSVPGAAAGIFYNRFILYGLSTIWQGAVGISDLMIHIKAPSILTGVLSGTGMAVFAMWLATRNFCSRFPARSGTTGSRISVTRDNRRLWISLTATTVFFICSIFILLSENSGEGEVDPGAFFITGGLLLAAGLGLFNTILLASSRRKKTSRPGIAGMGLKNISRRRGRSIATIALLACGIFIVAAVGVNRNDTISDPVRRDSGTGGFAFYGETTLPVLYDLNSDTGRNNFRLSSIEGEGVRFVQLRVHEGDDASCLNLNRIENPRLLGVNPEELAVRGSFSFIKTMDRDTGENPWLLLNKHFDKDTIPAIADHTVMSWGIKKSVGDTMEYTDERGNKFKLILVAGLGNSIFQGNILISEKSFLERFPSASGSRVLLIDLPENLEENNVGQISEKLLKAFRDIGLDMVPSAQRLLEFNSVQNTYLSIFLVLGGLGLILGSFGIGIVVIRNTIEMRGELALLRAIGLKRRSLTLMLLAEHLPLLAAGLICGTAAAVAASLPALFSPGRDLPFVFMAVILGIIEVSGTILTYIAVKLAARGDLLPALSKE
jgi:putative ABC transport system permease protein